MSFLTGIVPDGVRGETLQMSGINLSIKPFFQLSFFVIAAFLSISDNIVEMWSPASSSGKSNNYKL